MSVSSHHDPVRLGTRGSLLARTQAEQIAAALRRIGAAVELVCIETQGDVRTESLQLIGGQGLFTKEIQRALLDRRVDLAVHSLKDLPTATTPGLRLAATPPRESVADAMLLPENKQVLRDGSQLPAAARVGTGSVRRQAQLLRWRPDLVMTAIRGNVDTRLKKLDAGQFDAIVLAAAGLTRLGIQRPYWRLPLSIMLPAVGQGALGLECRDDDQRVDGWIRQLNHAPTLASVTAERALLATLQGGCLAPVAAWGRVEEDGALHLDAAVLSPDGRRRLDASSSGLPEEAVNLGRQLAQSLLKQGAADFL